MLQLKNITKTYKVAGFEQTALNGLSVTFRDNEFAAILGPSGSGKTTLLNIIGGLDQADVGRLLIDGISTELYKDRDWDTYRNNRIGFVFQSYNLISHQTVLANVELALTLSGVSKTERTRRAAQVLKEVGLADHMHKKPNQLSGGQMQRVAIARALVNNPEIVLADEPTGALDSKTSLQIMDLLTRIAKDRLVIMVTHNSDLADTYATRTINLSDGQIFSDSNPYTVDATHSATKKTIRRTSMSFLTSLSLSFSNLMTKKGRSIMTAFAGSIGIIGIAAILALANGVNMYIKNVEESTLSQYPLSITSSGIDLASMLVGSSDDSDEGVEPDQGQPDSIDADDGTLREVSMLSNVFKSITTNDLEALKVFLDGKSKSAMGKYVNAIEYSYDLTPQIYLGDTSQKARQVNPDTMSQMMSPASASSAMSFGMNMSVFNPMPRNSSLVAEQYDVLSGKWPTAYNECVMVLMAGEGVSDYMMYLLGLRDPELLQQMLNDFMNQKNVNPATDDQVFNYQDVLGVDLRLVLASEYYSYDSVYGVYVDHRDDQDYLKDLVNRSERLNIVGIIAPKPDSTLTPLQPGINYSPDLVDHLMAKAGESKIVQDQLAQPQVDVFTGKTFEQINSEGSMAGFDLSKMLTINTEGLGNAFNLDNSALSGINFAGMLDPNALTAAMPTLPAMDLTTLLATLEMSDLPLEGLGKFATAVLGDYLADRLSGSNQNNQQLLDDFVLYLEKPEVQAILTAMLPTAIDTAKLNALTGEIFNEYLLYLGSNPNPVIDFSTWLEQKFPTLSTELAQIINIDGISALVIELVGGYLSQTTVSVTDDFTQWLTDPVNAAKVQKYFLRDVDINPLLQKISITFTSYLQKTMETFMTQFMTALQQQLTAGMASATSQLTKAMSTAMGMTPETFQDMFKFNFDNEELGQLMLSLMNTQQKTHEANLKLLGYANPAIPSGISIYPIDFESKQEVLNILDNYNLDMKAAGTEDKVIAYTDIVGALMSSVTDIIDMISMVLVAFVAISLIVSSIMIGIVTYISVLERKKEIGILRSIGASKRNVGNVFNAETLIIGFTAGIIGILVTALICIPTNIIVESNFDVANLAQLPLGPSIALIGISSLLSFVAGLIPSAAASRRNLVESLRSE